MAKHRRYSRKRKSQRRRHNYSRKMRGGVDTSSSIDLKQQFLQDKIHQTPVSLTTNL